MIKDIVHSKMKLSLLTCSHVVSNRYDFLPNTQARKGKLKQFQMHSKTEKDTRHLNEKYKTTLLIMYQKMSYLEGISCQQFSFS